MNLKEMNLQTYLDEQVNEKLFSTTLDNGLAIYLIPKEGFQSKYALFATQYGSNDSRFIVPKTQQEVQVPDGIAHFLEHKMFEEKEGNVFGDFAELGVSANAFTNYYMTAYLFSGTNNFAEGLKTLLDFVQRPYFTDENVEKEKGIIEQEIRMYDDHPGWRVQRNLLEGLYHKHPVRIDIAGTVKSIYQITKDMLYDCYNTFYHPSNMVLFLIGDFDPQEVAKLVKNNQEKKNYSLQPDIKRLYPEEPKGVFNVVTRENMAVSVPIMAMGFKDDSSGLLSDSLLQKEIMTNIISHIILGKSSPLFNQLYEQGLITEDFSVHYQARPDYAHTTMGCPTPHPEKLYQALLTGIDQVLEQGINQEDFERIKKKFMGLYVASYDSLSMVANRSVSYYFKGIDFFEYPKVLRSITLEETNKRLREHFAIKNHAVSMVLPE